MKSSLVFGWVLVTKALAKPSFTNSNYDVQPGEGFTIAFTGCEGGCTIELLNGRPTDLKTYEVLTTDASGGSFIWKPDDNLPSDDYVFEITNNDTGDYNYSSQWPYTASDSSASSNSDSDTDPSTTPSPEPPKSTPKPSPTTTRKPPATSSEGPTTSSEKHTTPKGEPTTTTESPSVEETFTSEPTSTSSSESSSGFTEATSTITSSVTRSKARESLATSTGVSEDSSSTQTTSNSAGPKKHFLKSGALGGIIAGSVSAILIILVAMFCWWRRRRGKSASHGNASDQPIAELEQSKGAVLNNSPTSSSEMQGSTPPPQPVEVWGQVRSTRQPIVELGAEKQLHVYSESHVAELSGKDKSQTFEPPPETAILEMDTENQPAQRVEAGGEPVPSSIQQSPQEPPQAHPELEDSSVAATGLEQASEKVSELTSSPSVSLSTNAESTQARTSLTDQYAQLEARRQRLLELNRIEEEQAQLQQRLKEMPGNETG